MSITHKQLVEKVALKSRVVNAVLWLGVTKVIGQAISWTITVYVARILSPDDYGLMGMAVVLTGFIILFNEIGLGSAIVQKKDLTDEDLSSIYWIILTLNIALYILTYFMAPVAALFFGEPRLTDIIRIIAINFIIVGIGSVSYYMLTREITFKRRSQAEFIGSMAGGVSTLIFAVKGFGVWSIVYGSLIFEGTKNILYMAYYPWRPRLSFSYSRIKGMVNFGLKVAVGRLFWYSYSNSDYLIGGKLLGKTLLGYYFLAFQLASMPMEKIVSLVTQVALPAFSELQNDPERLKMYFLKMVRFAAFLTFPLFMGIFLVADDAVYLFLTEKWAPIILPLKILCIVSTLRAINALNAPLVVAKGRPGLTMLCNLALAIVLPVAFYIGSSYGLEGFSYSWLFAFPILFVGITYISIKQAGITLFDYMMELKDIFIAAAFMTLFVTLLQNNILSEMERLPRLIISVVAGAFSYLLYFSIFNRMIFAETLRLFRR
jgi:O-antigen/teichoic acid export membrane protein